MLRGVLDHLYLKHFLSAERLNLKKVLIRFAPLTSYNKDKHLVEKVKLAFIQICFPNFYGERAGKLSKNFFY